MLQLWQKRLLLKTSQEYQEFTTAGEYTATLRTGKVYNITVIGAGGGSVVAHPRSGGNNFWANGGVGGTIQIQYAPAQDTELLITVGKYGNSKAQIFVQGASLTGIAGGDSVVEFPNGKITARGGTGANFTADMPTSGITTAGIIGTNSSTVPRAPITHNNDIEIISRVGNSDTNVPKATAVQFNENWPMNPDLGAAGECGWNARGMIIKQPQSGAIIIQTA